MRATDELDYNTSRECRSASVQSGIVLTVFGDIHLFVGTLGVALAQQTCVLSPIEKCAKSLEI